MNKNTTINEGSAEIGKKKDTKNLFERLAEFRKKLKSVKGNEQYSALFFIAVGTVIFSLTNIVFLVLITYALKSFVPSFLQTVATFIKFGFGFLLLTMISSMATFLIDIVIKMVNILRRSEDDRADETYQETFFYIDQGKVIAGEFDMKTLESVERRVKSKLSALSERTGFCDSIVKYLPPAVTWVIIFVVITFLFDARKLATILSDQQVTGVGKFQEQITNHIFSGITSIFHPLTIFDLLMYALAFAVCAKVIPVLLNVTAARRTARYRDYLNVLEEAIAVSKEREKEDILKATITLATPN